MQNNTTNDKQKLIAKVNKACDRAIESAKNISVAGEDAEMIAFESAEAITELAAIIREMAIFLFI